MIVKNLSADTKYILDGVEVDAKITIPHATTDGVDHLTNSITLSILPDRVSDKNTLYSIILNPKKDDELDSKSIETGPNKITRDEAISYIIEHNNNVEDISECFTKLCFIDENGNRDYVLDFSPFLDEEYMSEGLVGALINGRSLNSLQEKEIERYIIEKEYSCPVKKELVLSKADIMNLLQVIEELKHIRKLLALDNSVVVFKENIINKLLSL